VISRSANLIQVPQLDIDPATYTLVAVFGWEEPVLGSNAYLHTRNVDPGVSHGWLSPEPRGALPKAAI